MRRFSAAVLLVLASCGGESTGAPPSVATILAPYSVTAQTATVGSPVSVPPAVRVTDAHGSPMSGITVTFSVTSGGGQVTAATSSTGSNGVAAVGSWTLGNTAGPNVLIATAPGLTGSPTSFTASGTAGPPSSAAIMVGNGQTAQVGSAVPIPPALKVTDALGNPVAGVSVNFAVSVGAGSLTAAHTTTGVDGLAAVGGWTLGPKAGSNALTTTVAGLAVAPSFSATGTPGSASRLVIAAGNNQSATIGSAVALRPALLVTDVYDNAVAAVVVTFAVSSGGGTVTGPVATTGADGIATVGSYTLGTAAGVNTLVATVAGGTGSATFTATGTAGAAQVITLVAGNSQTASVGTVVGLRPTVRVADAAGNAVAGVAVTFAASGNGIMGAVPNLDVLTANDGTAAVSWTLSTTAGANTLTASAAGLTGSPVMFTATGTSGTASSIAIAAGNHQTGTVSTTLAVRPAVKVSDALGSGVAGVTVRFTASGNGFMGAVSTRDVLTGSEGTAAVTWTLSSTVGTDTLTVTAQGLAGSPLIVTATVGGPTTIAVAAGNNQTATVGTAVAILPAVRVTDAVGNPVPGIAVTFAIASGGGTMNSHTARSGADGIATVMSNWILGATAGVNTLTATSPGLTGSPVTFTASGVAPRAAATIAIATGNHQTATVGTGLSVRPAVTVRDAQGNAVAGTVVTFSVAAGGGTITGATATSQSDGIATVGSWTLGATTGTNTLTATAAGLTGSPLTFTATATGGPAATITIVAGNDQTGTLGRPLNVRPAVKVTDALGNAVAGTAVTFAVASGGGTITGATATSDTDGIATAGIWTLGAAPGINTLTATAAGLTGSALTFNAVYGANTATIVVITAGDNQTATVGTALSVRPAVKLTDEFGSPFIGVSVSFTVTAGGGTITGGLTNTVLSGVATAGSWTLGTTPGTNTLMVTVPGLPNLSATFTATATGAAASAVAIIAGNNQSATVGTALNVRPAVKVSDVQGNAVAGTVVTFAVASGGGAITGATATSGTDGIATIGSWTLGGSAGANTLTATAPGLAGSPLTFTATGLVASAGSLAIASGNNQAATVGTALSVRPAATVTDAQGNAVAGTVVTFAVASGGGTITGATATSGNDGIATVGSWTLGTTAGTNTLTATAAGLTGSPLTFTATGAAGSARAIAIGAGDNQSAAIGAAVAVRPVVKVTDSFGNGVAGTAVTFTVASGGGTVTGASATSGTDGLATVGSWTLGATAGPNTLTATATGLSGSPLTLTATATGPRSNAIIKVAGDSGTAQPGSPVSPGPTVRIVDSLGNPMAGVTVVFAVTSGGGSVTGATQVTSASGIATVGSWNLGPATGEPVTNALTATAGSLAATFTASLPAPCTRFTVLPPSSTVNSSYAPGFGSCLQNGRRVEFFTLMVTQPFALHYLYHQPTDGTSGLEVFSSTGRPIAANTSVRSSGKDLNAYLPAGTYQIRASVDFFGGPPTGTFSLTQALSASPPPCGVLTFALLRSAKIDRLPCDDTRTIVGATDSEVIVYLAAGEHFSTYASATAFSPTVTLYAPNGATLARGPSGVFDFAAPTTGFYRVAVTDGPQLTPRENYSLYLGPP